MVTVTHRGDFEDHRAGLARRNQRRLEMLGWEHGLSRVTWRWDERTNEGRRLGRAFTPDLLGVLMVGGQAARQNMDLLAMRFRIATRHDDVWERQQNDHEGAAELRERHFGVQS